MHVCLCISLCVHLFILSLFILSPRTPVGKEADGEFSSSSVVRLVKDGTFCGFTLVLPDALESEGTTATAAVGWKPWLVWELLEKSRGDRGVKSPRGNSVRNCTSTADAVVPAGMAPEKNKFQLTHAVVTEEWENYGSRSDDWAVFVWKVIYSVVIFMSRLRGSVYWQTYMFYQWIWQKRSKILWEKSQTKLTATIHKKVLKHSKGSEWMPYNGTQQNDVWFFAQKSLFQSNEQSFYTKTKKP